MTMLNEAADTLSQIDSAWILVGKILAILTVIVGLIKAVEFLWDKSPTSKIESRLKEAELRLEKGDKRFDEIDRKIISIEEKIDRTQDQIKEISKGIQMLGKAEISLINHMINGNGIDEMRKEVKELTDYFIER